MKVSTNNWSNKVQKKINKWNKNKKWKKNKKKLNKEQKKKQQQFDKKSKTLRENQQNNSSACKLEQKYQQYNHQNLVNHQQKHINQQVKKKKKKKKKHHSVNTPQFASNEHQHYHQYQEQSYHHNQQQRQIQQEPRYQHISHIQTNKQHKKKKKQLKSWRKQQTLKQHITTQEKYKNRKQNNNNNKKKKRKKMTDDIYYTRDQLNHTPPTIHNINIIIHNEHKPIMIEEKFDENDSLKEAMELVMQQISEEIKNKIVGETGEIEVITIKFGKERKPIYSEHFEHTTIKDLVSYGTTIIEIGQAGDLVEPNEKLKMEDEEEEEEGEDMFAAAFAKEEKDYQMYTNKEQNKVRPPEVTVHVTFEEQIKAQPIHGNYFMNTTLFDIAEWIYTKSGEDSIVMTIQSKKFKEEQFHTIILKQLEPVTQKEGLPTVTIKVERVATKLHEDAIEYSPLPSLLERAKYIPIRLGYEDRKYLRIANSTLSCLDYTTQIDKIELKPIKRFKKAIELIIGALSSIALATNYKEGVNLVQGSANAFGRHSKYFSDVLELARRYKIMNPEKMRSEYGKLIYCLQDAVVMRQKQLLSVKMIKRVSTVYDTLASADALDLLEHEKIHIATRDIIQDEKRKISRSQLERTKKEKYAAIKSLGRRFENEYIDDDNVKLCLYSIADANTFLNQSARPVTIMIDYLKKYFKPGLKNGVSLAIESGSSGSRLTHSHNRQYNFVLQSLMLWECIIRDMYRLWFLSEQDLLNEKAPYVLKDTGQGIHRVQQASHVYRAMLGILNYIKREVGVENWVGSSRIHLGDHNVPNCLMFIDKYTQVPRIINPIIQTLRFIDSPDASLYSLDVYLKASFGTKEALKLSILTDFFKHAFDGSGASTFQDAGSCIDGRLTSAWNWCSQLSSKPYYRVFLLAGFTSFDGEFQD